MTQFEKLKETLTVEQFASMIVKLVIMNGSDPFYVTTTGQLYPMNQKGLDAAIRHEIRFWNSELTSSDEDKECSVIKQ